ncbi:hypothetical protein MSPP1_002072 [Malassezia sp. CBS 17886]|nr:hypothetical protein MSPP1_002072 [Malassezia sp. CBS 17886]
MDSPAGDTGVDAGRRSHDARDAREVWERDTVALSDIGSVAALRPETKGAQPSTGGADAISLRGTITPPQRRAARVRIPRVFDGRETYQFSTHLPDELHGEVDATAFTKVMTDINGALLDGWNPVRGLRDNFLGSMTFQLWPLLFGTHAKRRMTEARSHMDAMEQTLLAPAGWHLEPPDATGNQFLEMWSDA